MQWKIMKFITSFLGCLCLCLACCFGSLDGLYHDYKGTVSVSQKSKAPAKKGKKRSIKKKIRKPKRVKTQVALIDSEDSV